MVGVRLFEDADKAFSTRSINSLKRRVVPYVVRIADRRQVPHQLAAPGVKYQKLGGAARPNEKPLAGIIERHGGIGGAFSQAPARPHGPLRAGEGEDLAGTRGSVE